MFYASFNVPQKIYALYGNDEELLYYTHITITQWEHIQNIKHSTLIIIKFIWSHNFTRKFMQFHAQTFTFEIECFVNVVM